MYFESYQQTQRAAVIAAAFAREVDNQRLCGQVLNDAAFDIALKLAHETVDGFEGAVERAAAKRLEAMDQVEKTK